MTKILHIKTFQFINEESEIIDKTVNNFLEWINDSGAVLNDINIVGSNQGERLIIVVKYIPPIDEYEV